MNRRTLLQGLGAFTAGLVAGEVAPLVVPLLRQHPLRRAILPNRNEGNWASFEFLTDPVMNDQFRSYLAQMLFGAADLGECLDTASRITISEPTSWYHQWKATGDRVLENAHASMAVGKSLSAASAFYRASSYYRASLIHYANQKNNPEVQIICEKIKSSFDLANQLSNYPLKYLEIRYEDTTLPAFFARSPIAPNKAPLLIFHQGRDAWPEDTKWIYDNAIRRGIHCLGVHAPGQGLAIRLQGLPFRFDWEHVVTPIVDFAHTLSGIDTNRIALMGLSMGGALVPRALAFEKRIKIGIANPGVLNWGATMFERFSSIPGVIHLYNSSPDKFNSTMFLLAGAWETADWWLKDSMWKHGASTPHELFNELKKYNNEDVVQNINAHMLIMDGDGEEFSTGQAKMLFNALKCKKDFMNFDKSTTAHLHCQNGGTALASERLFNWLEDCL